MRRLAFALAALLLLGAAAPTAFDPVAPGHAFAFPRDRGAHPGHRIEWWYVTGQLDSARGPLGFQVTFFRLRNPQAEAQAGRFAPRQLLFAHAALADPRAGRLLHDQRAARMMEGLVEAATNDTALRLDRWTLARDAASGAYATRVEADTFALELTFEPTQALLLQGDAGYSRKGPGTTQASYYYSEPQLRVRGRVRAHDETLAVTGRAWLDHEWSSEILAPEAAGWDWLGANLDDGSALMAFRIRRADGSVLWADALLRDRDGRIERHAGEGVRFTPRRRWKSPHTGTEYPVAMTVEVGTHRWELEPLLDDQELDARASTGTVYWEGAVGLRGATPGRGYLELTGYGGRLPL